MMINIFQDKIQEYNQRLKKDQEDDNNFKKELKKLRKENSRKEQ